MMLYKILEAHGGPVTAHREGDFLQYSKEAVGDIGFC